MVDSEHGVRLAASEGGLQLNDGLSAPSRESLGNLSENPKAFLFLMDYANSRRIKVWGTARVVEGDAALVEKLRDRDYSGEAERAILFAIEAWDVNCPQHIHRRFSERLVAPVIEALKGRIADLEAEVTRLRPRNNKSLGA